MAWGVCLGLKRHIMPFHMNNEMRLNGLGCLFRIETWVLNNLNSTKSQWLNGLGSLFRIETTNFLPSSSRCNLRLNGLGSLFRIETAVSSAFFGSGLKAKWPGEPVLD